MDHRETVALLWPDPRGLKRGPKPRISLDQIVQTAIAFADAEGLDAVSMQRIADRLGVTKMSLYRYAPAKSGLLALMLDRALGEPPEPPQATGSGDWRAELRAWALALFEPMSEHPWSLTLAVGVRPFGPNELGWTEAGLRALRTTSLSGAARLDVLALVSGHVRAITQQSAGSQTPDVESGYAEVMADLLNQRGDRYPEVVAAFADAAASDDQNNALEFGLDRILDGIERYAEVTA